MGEGQGVRAWRPGTEELGRFLYEPLTLGHRPKVCRSRRERGPEVPAT